MTDPNPPSASFRDTLGFLLQRASKISASLSAVNLPDGIDLRHFGILSVLRVTPSMSQKELGDVLAINRTVMVSLVDELEKRRWVERGRDSGDRRAYAVTIAPEGITAWPALRTALHSADTKLSAALGRHTARLAQILRESMDGELIASIEGLSDSISFLISRVHYVHASTAKEFLRPSGIDPREFGALSALDETGPTTQLDLARYMHISAPAILEILDSLSNRDLIVRERKPADRRANDVILSELGRETLSSARNHVKGARVIEDRIGTLDADELCNLLRRVIGSDE